MDLAWKDRLFKTRQIMNERQFEGAAHNRSEYESRCNFNLNKLFGLILDGNWTEVERHLLYFTRIGHNELSRDIHIRMHLHKHWEDFQEHRTSKKKLDEIQAKRMELVNYMKHALPRLLMLQSFIWQQSRNLVPAPQPKFLSLYPDHRRVRGQHVSQIALNTQDSGSAWTASAAPQRLTTCTAQIGLGALTNTIPSNTPVRMNYSNTGQSARREFPTSVARTLDQSSSISSMDFNPVHSTILLVGTVVGDIALWEVDSGKMTLRPPQLWDTESLSPELLLAFEDASISVSRVRWNQDGTLFGVAYSKHIIQLFSYPGSDEILRHKEINAHIGSVNDLLFSGKLLFTCGSDGIIKVWDSAFQLIWVIEGCEGDEALVYSLCPVFCGDTRFLISHSLDGGMKVQTYDQRPTSSTSLFRSWQCTTKSYIADSKRLFTSGTDEHGKAYIVEWQVSNGERKVKRAFQGLYGYRGHLHFDLNKNSILAAGYKQQIKFWDIDNGSLLGISLADGNLPDVPLIQFNKDGNLLAVTSSNNRINILASRDGMQLLQTRKIPHLAASGATANTSFKRSIQQICNEISPLLFPASDAVMRNNLAGTEK